MIVRPAEPHEAAALALVPGVAESTLGMRLMARPVG